MAPEARRILDFWFGEIPAARWFSADPAFDDELRRRFQDLWQEARAGRLDDWKEEAEGALALVLLLDQFPRNMFRGRPEAYATDERARRVVEHAVGNGFDLALLPERRQFLYMPLMHSERLADQERCVAFIGERLGKEHFSYPFAVRHRDVIARFGRFPARNKALSRETTPEEAEFLAQNPAGF